MAKENLDEMIKTAYLDRKSEAMYIFSKEKDRTDVVRVAGYSFPYGHSFNGGVRNLIDLPVNLVPATLEDYARVVFQSPLYHMLQRKGFLKESNALVEEAQREIGCTD